MKLHIDKNLSTSEIVRLFQLNNGIDEIETVEVPVPSLYTRTDFEGFGLLEEREDYVDDRSLAKTHSADMVKQMSEISFTCDDKNIIITIPNDLLSYVARNHPEFPLVVNDEKRFAEAVTEELREGLGDGESGLTGFQVLLDEACFNVSCEDQDFCFPVETE